MATLEIKNGIPADETIGGMVTKDMRKASVFRKYGIDFCCGGKRTLQQVCADKNINFTSIEADLLESEKGISALPVNAGEWSPGFLADYIVEIHHSYVKKAIPDLLAWSEKVARVHGMEHPETVQVHKVFSNVCEELESHMVKEENVLFPYIRELDEARKAGGFAQRPDFGTVKNPISMMEHEHEYVGELIMKIQKLTDHYNPPSGACNTFRALYSALRDFEDDLFLHIHLENNILFPKAEQLERELKAE